MFNNKTLTEIDIELLQKKYPHNYQKKIELVKNNYPVQYLIGDVDFLNTKILVNENVLIPRFETEYLVEKVINRLKKFNNLKILDICTGSGCIAIALAKNLSCQISALDISKKALKVAKKNAKLNNVNINFYQQDILKTKNIDQFDVYISNPPYVVKGSVIDETIKYEPEIALYAKDNGLEFYEKIIALISNKPRLIAFEIGDNQETSIASFINQKFPDAKISIEKDLIGKNRYIFIECI